MQEARGDTGTRSRSRLGSFLILGTGLLCVAVAILATKGTKEPDAAEVAALVRKENPHAQENRERIDAAVSAVQRSAEATGAAPGAPSPTVRTPAPPVGPEGDDEWLRLPRTRLDLHTTVDKYGDLRAEQLFRNVHLNAADRHIPKDARQRLEAWLSARTGPLQQLLGAIGTVSDQELAFLIERGLARTASYAAYEAAAGPEHEKEKQRSIESTRQRMTAFGATPEAIEKATREQMVFDPLVLCAGAIAYKVDSSNDHVYLGDLERMPQTRSAADAYRAAVLEFYRSILGFFREQGCIDEMGVTKAMARVERELVRYELRTIGGK